MSNEFIDPKVKNDGRTYDQLSNDNIPNKDQVNAMIAAGTSSAKAYKGGYDAATNTPDLDTTPIAGIQSGDVYDVTAAGTFFTIDVEVGDTLTARQDDPTLESHWVISQANLTPASIKTQYESNADTNAFTDAQQTKLAGIEAGADVTDAANVNPVESDPVVGAINGLVKANGAGTIAAAVEDTDYQGVLAEGAFVDGDKTKLNGIEAGADVTDAANVNPVESDPVVGAINGIVKANGAGTIAAAVEDTDYQGVLAEGAFADGDKTKLDGIEAGADVTDATNVNAVESDPVVGAITGLVKANGIGTISAAVANTDYQVPPSEGAFADGDKSKLNGIETGADVTDTANVDAAGATMNADTDVSANGWVVDEDDMASDLATKVPTQQSVKAYHDNFKIQQKTGSYTLAAGDNGTYLRMYNLSAALITIPLESSVNFPIGAWVEVSWEAPGSVGITAPVGVTLNNNSAAPTIYLGARWDSARLTKVAADEWTVAVSGFKSDITIPSYTPTGTTQDIDWSEGAKQIVDLGSATGDVTLTFSNLQVSRDYYLKFIQGATARNVILPSGIKVPGHTSPVTLTITPTDDDEDVFQFYWSNTEGYGELLGRTALDYDTDVSGKAWVIDEDNMVSDDATKVPTQQSVKAFVESLSLKQELYTVTATDVTNGYFTLTGTPNVAAGVRVEALDGVAQLHKQTTGIGAETPDFDVLSSNQVHINNNGAATGLSGNIIANDVLLITYIG